MTQVLFTNARIFDGVSEDCLEGMQLLVEDDRIVEISSAPISAPSARALDVDDGDPPKDISLLASDGADLHVIMRGGELVKCEL